MSCAHSWKACCYAHLRSNLEVWNKSYMAIITTNVSNRPETALEYLLPIELEHNGRAGRSHKHSFITYSGAHSLNRVRMCSTSIKH